jgi:CRISPR-associated endonuclease/helicase Cas3
MPAFDDFFREVTVSEDHPHGYVPHGYQRRLALNGLPDVVEAPTGTGKTGIILAWLWRRMHDPVPETTPRRLIYALPQRSLVEQTAGEAEKWLANLGLTGQVALHVVMGGTSADEQRQWRLDMHKPAIVVGTVDSLVSKALNRGYGISRATYPIDFALVTNGAHWVIDEIQLCRESTTTLRQLAAFAKRYETAEPFALTCMSATIPKTLLETVDNPETGDAVGVLPEERTGELAIRLNAARTIRRLDARSGDHEAIAAAALDRHRSGELTLVVLNTVDAARAVHKHLRKAHANCTLLHSRFRATERKQLLDEVIKCSNGRIVVATQVIEAGIDLNSAVLITEAAPWPSVVQRAGRCNRTGTINGAELWWIPPAKALPYEQEDIEAAVAALSDLEGRPMTSEGLLARIVKVAEQQVSVLRRPDFIALFDTSPDLSGSDVDIAPYIRDTDDLDAQLAWATWSPEGDDGAPPSDAKAPTAEYRCRVPLGQVNELAKKVKIWRLDQVLGRWTRVHQQARARPGEVLVVNAADGGYDPVTGFDLSAKGPVPGSLSLDTKADPPSGTEDSYGADSSNVQQWTWMKLDVHSEQVRDQAAKLLDVIKPDLSAAVAQSAVTAAYLHDVGKAHEIWQDALCGTAHEEEREERSANRPWAKSASDKRLRFVGGVAFRHELASLLMLDGPLSDLLSEAPDQNLARYLVLSHHGKLRLQVRDPGDLTVLAPDEAAEDKILGLQHGANTSIPAMLGRPETELTVDLDQFKLGGERSWTRTALTLRDTYGPFRLAYLEAVVRIADWRASAEMGDPE